MSVVNGAVVAIVGALLRFHHGPGVDPTSVYVRAMPGGTPGPSGADVRSFSQRLRESSSSFRKDKMDRALKKLLRDTHTLGRVPNSGAEYRKLRRIVAREAAEYHAWRDAWAEALVAERATGHRMDVSRRLGEIMVGALTKRRDDPLQPVSQAIREAIDWLREGV